MKVQIVKMVPVQHNRVVSSNYKKYKKILRKFLNFHIFLVNILGDSMYVRTPRGMIPKRLLRPAVAGYNNEDNQNSGILLTDKGELIQFLLKIERKYIFL